MSDTRPGQVWADLNLLHASPRLEDRVICAIADAGVDDVYDLSFIEIVNSKSEWLTREQVQRFVQSAAVAAIEIVQAESEAETARLTAALSAAEATVKGWTDWVERVSNAAGHSKYMSWPRATTIEQHIAELEAQNAAAMELLKLARLGFSDIDKTELLSIAADIATEEMGRIDAFLASPSPASRIADVVEAARFLSNEVIASGGLFEAIARRELGNTNYAVMMQRAQEVRDALAHLDAPANGTNTET